MNRKKTIDASFKKNSKERSDRASESRYQSYKKTGSKSSSTNPKDDSTGKSSLGNKRLREPDRWDKKSHPLGATGEKDKSKDLRDKIPKLLRTITYPDDKDTGSLVIQLTGSKDLSQSQSLVDPSYGEPAGVETFDYSHGKKGSVRTKLKEGSMDPDVEVEKALKSVYPGLSSSLSSEKHKDDDLRSLIERQRKTSLSNEVGDEEGSRGKKSSLSFRDALLGYGDDDKEETGTLDYLYAKRKESSTLSGPSSSAGSRDDYSLSLRRDLDELVQGSVKRKDNYHSRNKKREGPRSPSAFDLGRPFFSTGSRRDADEDATSFSDSMDLRAALKELAYLRSIQSGEYSLPKEEDEYFRKLNDLSKTSLTADSLELLPDDKGKHGDSGRKRKLGTDSFHDGKKGRLFDSKVTSFQDHKTFLTSKLAFQPKWAERDSRGSHKSRNDSGEDLGKSESKWEQVIDSIVDTSTGKQKQARSKSPSAAFSCADNITMDKSVIASISRLSSENFYGPALPPDGTDAYPEKDVNRKSADRLPNEGKSKNDQDKRLKDSSPPIPKHGGHWQQSQRRGTRGRGVRGFRGGRGTRGRGGATFRGRGRGRGRGFRGQADMTRGRGTRGRGTRGIFPTRGRHIFGNSSSRRRSSSSSSYSSRSRSRSRDRYRSYSKRRRERSRSSSSSYSSYSSRSNSGSRERSKGNKRSTHRSRSSSYSSYSRSRSRDRSRKRSLSKSRKGKHSGSKGRSRSRSWSIDEDYTKEASGDKAKSQKEYSKSTESKSTKTAETKGGEKEDGKEEVKSKVKIQKNNETSREAKVKASNIPQSAEYQKRSNLGQTKVQYVEKTISVKGKMKDADTDQAAAKATKEQKDTGMGQAAAKAIKELKDAGMGQAAAKAIKELKDAGMGQATAKALKELKAAAVSGVFLPRTVSQSIKGMKLPQGRSLKASTHPVFRVPVDEEDNEDVEPLIEQKEAPATSKKGEAAIRKEETIKEEKYKAIFESEVDKVFKGKVKENKKEESKDKGSKIVKVELQVSTSKLSDKYKAEESKEKQDKDKSTQEGEEEKEKKEKRKKDKEERSKRKKEKKEKKEKKKKKAAAASLDIFNSGNYEEGKISKGDEEQVGDEGQNLDSMDSGQPAIAIQSSLETVKEGHMTEQVGVYAEVQQQYYEEGSEYYDQSQAQGWYDENGEFHQFQEEELYYYDEGGNIIEGYEGVQDYQEGAEQVLQYSTEGGDVLCGEEYYNYEGVAQEGYPEVYTEGEGEAQYTNEQVSDNTAAAEQYGYEAYQAIEGTECVEGEQYVDDANIWEGEYAENYIEGGEQQCYTAEANYTEGGEEYAEYPYDASQVGHEHPVELEQGLIVQLDKNYWDQHQGGEETYAKPELSETALTGKPSYKEVIEYSHSGFAHNVSSEQERGPYKAVPTGTAVMQREHSGRRGVGMLPLGDDGRRHADDLEMGKPEVGKVRALSLREESSPSRPLKSILKKKYPISLKPPVTIETKRMESISNTTKSAITSEDKTPAEHIGPEFIVRLSQVDPQQFYCRLCDCHFDSVVAKELHVKSMKHIELFIREKSSLLHSVLGSKPQVIEPQTQDLDTTQQDKDKGRKMKSTEERSASEKGSGSDLELQKPPKVNSSQFPEKRMPRHYQDELGFSAQSEESGDPRSFHRSGHPHWEKRDRAFEYEGKERDYGQQLQETHSYHERDGRLGYERKQRFSESQERENVLERGRLSEFERGTNVLNYEERERSYDGSRSLEVSRRGEQFDYERRDRLHLLEERNKPLRLEERPNEEGRPQQIRRQDSSRFEETDRQITHTERDTFERQAGRSRLPESIQTERIPEYRREDLAFKGNDNRVQQEGRLRSWELEERETSQFFDERSRRHPDMDERELHEQGHLLEGMARNQSSKLIDMEWGALEEQRRQAFDNTGRRDDLWEGERQQREGKRPPIIGKRENLETLGEKDRSTFHEEKGRTPDGRQRQTQFEGRVRSFQPDSRERGPRLRERLSEDKERQKQSDNSTNERSSSAERNGRLELKRQSQHGSGNGPEKGKRLASERGVQIPKTGITAHKGHEADQLERGNRNLQYLQRNKKRSEKRENDVPLESKDKDMTKEVEEKKVSLPTSGSNFTPEPSKKAEAGPQIGREKLHECRGRDIPMSEAKPLGLEVKKTHPIVDEKEKPQEKSSESLHETTKKDSILGDAPVCPPTRYWAWPSKRARGGKRGRGVPPPPPPYRGARSRPYSKGGRGSYPIHSVRGVLPPSEETKSFQQATSATSTSLHIQRREESLHLHANVGGPAPFPVTQNIPTISPLMAETSGHTSPAFQDAVKQKLLSLAKAAVPHLAARGRGSLQYPSMAGQSSRGVPSQFLGRGGPPRGRGGLSQFSGRGRGRAMGSEFHGRGRMR